jgi:sulfur-carrier protein
VGVVTAVPANVVLAPALLRLYPDAPSRLVIAVGALIVALDARWPGMGHMLADERPALRRHINVFVAGARATLDTPLAPGAQVHILTSVSGG